MDESDKETQKKLKSLQRKWIEKVEPGQDDSDGLTMDFSDLDEAKKKDAKKKKKKKKDNKPKKEVLLPEEDEDKTPIPMGAPGAGVDYDLINEMIMKAVNIEVERAIRELKDEIRSSSQESKKDILEQLKLDIETVRQEVEFSGKSKRQKGLFERF